MGSFILMLQEITEKIDIFLLVLLFILVVFSIMYHILLSSHGDGEDDKVPTQHPLFKLLMAPLTLTRICADLHGCLVFFFFLNMICSKWDNMGTAIWQGDYES